MSLVEYYDPDNIFDVVAPYIYQRLPLSNLHWKSSTRPLRSIESLHVEFERADGGEAPNATLSKGTQPSADERAASGSPDGAGGDRPRPTANAGKGQRHQIPGLRQTPYLKLYLLRCDDKETYKSKSKDVLKAWIKDNVSQAPSAGKAHDNHDAFDWLVLHVVLPNTQAACEPRWSKKHAGIEEDVQKERAANSGRWAGKGSRTILERLRTDFNQSSKSAPDRIVQIRPAKDTVPSTMFPVDSPSGSTALSETPQEQENACDDLISRIKTVILSSFDLRVRQYEDDIKEKENQQSLPGWNFCTFFVLKEGLARAFESVGLIDDALAVYDELDAGLETCLRNRALGQNTDQATSFLAFTSELHDELVAARNGDATATLEDEVLDNEQPLPLRVVKKDYRGMIVSNAISIFDFRRYIFAREMSLLLRLANIRSSQYPTHENGTVSSQDLPSQRESSTPHPGAVHNAIALAELCRRAVQFVPSIARILRADLRAGFSAEGADIEEAETVIDNAVFSMTFSVAQQILDETAISDIAATLSNYDTNGTDTSKRSDHKSLRRSSVPTIPHAASAGRGQGFSKYASLLYSQGLKNISPIKNPELSNVAAYRAEIFLLQRRVLQSAGRYVGLYIDRFERSEIENSEARSTATNETPSSNHSLTLNNIDLRHAIASAEEFSKLYEALTDRAACHYAAANRIKSSEKLTADIAKLKFADGDYAAAALYFNQIIPSFSIQSWNSIETSILHLYAECLKALHRKDEYVRVALSLLTRAAEARGSNSGRHSTQRARSARRQPKSRPDVKGESLAPHNNLFAELVSFARDLPYDLNSPLQVYFTNLQINTSYKLYNDYDGFKMGLKVQQLLADRVTLDRITVRLVDPLDSQSREILLQNNDAIDLGPGESQLWLESRTSAVGQFIVEKVTFQAGRLSFVYEPLPRSETSKLLNLRNEDATDESKSTKPQSVLLYQRVGALYADMKSSKTTYIGKMRAIDLTLDTGSNKVESVDILLRSATGGLRIHCGEATSAESHVSIVDRTQPGKIGIGPLPAGSKVLVKIPYDLERNVAELSIRLDIHYTTEHGEFVFVASPVVPIELPLDITVQDLFKEKFFYSKFLIQPQSLIPIHLLDAEMRSSELYDAQALLEKFEPFVVFPRQPGNVTYRISKRHTSKASKPPGPKKSSPLLFEVSYRSLQDDVFSSVTSKFRSDIEGSSFHHLQRLLLQTLNKSLQLYFPLQDYQTSGLSGKVYIPGFNTIFWADVLDGLGEADRRTLQQWLEQWHKDNATIKIATPSDQNYADIYPASRVLIDFEIPHLNYLHTTSMHLADQSTKPKDKSAPVARIGDVLHAQLRTRHTRRWDLRASPAAADPSAAHEPFTYEVRADPADWLLIGQQRARFTAAADEAAPRVFDICLVPIRAGHLLLPPVEVWPARKQQDAEGEVASPGGGGAEDVSSQTDCTSVHQGVVVVEGMQSTTVGVGEGDDLTRGLALIGSELAEAAVLSARVESSRGRA